jgi:hypothetical protein
MLGRSQPGKILTHGLKLIRGSLPLGISLQPLRCPQLLRIGRHGSRPRGTMKGELLVPNRGSPTYKEVLASGRKTIGEVDATCNPLDQN